jgi:hypothetical protein
MRFGVQAHPGEADLHVAEAVIRKAHEMGLQFKRLDVLEPVSIGTARYFRMDAGLSFVSMTPLLDALLAEGRAVIGHENGNFTLRIGERKGVVPISTMQTTLRPPRVYRGPSDPYWDRQFP